MQYSKGVSYLLVHILVCCCSAAQKRGAPLRYKWCRRRFWSARIAFFAPKEKITEALLCRTDINGSSSKALGAIPPSPHTLPPLSHHYNPYQHHHQHHHYHQHHQRHHRHHHRRLDRRHHHQVPPPHLNQNPMQWLAMKCS